MSDLPDTQSIIDNAPRSSPPPLLSAPEAKVIDGAIDAIDKALRSLLTVGLTTPAAPVAQAIAKHLRYVCAVADADRAALLAREAALQELHSPPF